MKVLYGRRMYQCRCGEVYDQKKNCPCDFKHGQEDFPIEVISGYPEKKFIFTGEWNKQSLYSNRGSRVARRNRKTIWYPIFRSEDGETILVTWLAAKKEKDVWKVNASLKATE